MQTIKKRIAQEIVKAVQSINAEAELNAVDVAAMLEYPPDASMGDLAFPCFKLSKVLRRSPVQIAASLCEALKTDAVIGKVEAVNGYLNISISNEYLATEVLAEILTKGERYGAQSFGEGKMVVLDYSSPNVAKPFHIGHLGTTVIGHSLRKLHEFAGYRCYGINYLGDWGTQFGKLIAAYRKWGSREEVEAGGKEYLLVHAGIADYDPDSDLEDYLPEDFFSEPLDASYALVEGKTVIVGHVPTGSGKIERGVGSIFMDCGVCEGGKLACLCLETGEEFYA